MICLNIVIEVKCVPLELHLMYTPSYVSSSFLNPTNNFSEMGSQRKEKKFFLIKMIFFFFFCLLTEVVFTVDLSFFIKRSEGGILSKNQVTCFD